VIQTRLLLLPTHGWFFIGVCVFCPQDISKTDAARITKLDTEMFHHESAPRKSFDILALYKSDYYYYYYESWKSVYFGVKRSKFKVMRHKENIAGMVMVLL